MPAVRATGGRLDASSTRSTDEQQVLLLAKTSTLHAHTADAVELPYYCVLYLGGPVRLLLHQDMASF